MKARFTPLALKSKLTLLTFISAAFTTPASANFYDEQRIETDHQAYSWQSFQPLNLQITSDTYIRLLNWNDSAVNPPPPTEDYNRQKHFGGWISIRDDRSCLDVRNRVLVRDSQEKISMKPNNPCKIQSGVWYDPYIDQTFKSPTELDIDHLVPLKNAYINGASKWTNQQRCLYTNYMGFSDHLKPVSKSENIQKNDKDPSRYLPPNHNYRCEYLKKWLSIKLIWKLSLHVDEAQAIRRIIAQERCNTDEFVFSAQELNRQRRKINNLLPVCSFRNAYAD